MVGRRRSGPADGRTGGRGLRRTARLLAAAMLLGVPLGAQDVGLPVGTQARAVVIPDLDGKPFDLGQIVGKKPVLIQFWATWCPLCRDLLPALNAVRKQYGDRIELVGVNVTVNESRARARRYLEQHKPPYRPLWDEKGTAARAFDAPSTSYVVILDAGGRVVYTGVGADQDLVAAAARALPVK